MQPLLQIDINGPKWPYLKGKIKFLHDTYNLRVACHKSTMGYGDEDWQELGAFREECNQAGVIDAEYAWPDVTAPVDDQLKRIDALNTKFKPHWWGIDLEQWWSSWGLWQEWQEGKIAQSLVPVASPVKLATFWKTYTQGVQNIIGAAPLLIYTNYATICGYAPSLVDWIITYDLWDACYPYSINPRSGIRTYASADEMNRALAALPVHVCTFPKAKKYGAWQFTSQWQPWGTSNAFDLSVVDPVTFVKMAQGIVTLPIEPPVQPPTPQPVAQLYHLFAQYSWLCRTYIHTAPDQASLAPGTLNSRDTTGKLIDIPVYSIKNGWMSINAWNTQWVWGGNMTPVK
jgi:hypothetical protein